MGWGHAWIVAVAALIVLWGAVSAYVLVTRALFDFRHLAFNGARRVVHHWLEDARTDEQREAVLRRLPRRTLAGIASDARVPAEHAAVASRILLERRSSKLLLRAMRHRNEAEKWARVATIRIFALAGSPDAWPLLWGALHDDDQELVAAAVGLLGELDDEESTILLVHALVDELYPRSRVATHLDGRDVTARLLPLVDHPDEQLRYWAAMLLEPADDPVVELAVASLAGDPSPRVRAAVAKAFAAAGGPAAEAVAASLLRDPVWFVRAQAARALANSRPEAAEALVPLLRDDEWWVRTAAKDTLTGWGAEIAPLLEGLLADDDRFARNAAAELLFEAGVVEQWATQDLERSRDLLERTLGAGEEPMRLAFEQLRA